MRTEAITAEPEYATMYGTGFAVPEFAERFERIIVPPEIGAGFHLGLELRLLNALLDAARRRRGLLLYTSQGYLRVELLGPILIGLLLGRKRPAIVLYGEMYERDAGLRGWLERLVMTLANHWIDGYIVYPDEERAIFAQTWRVRQANVFACGYYHRPKVIPKNVQPADYVFAGGNSFRDYRSLIEAARMLPDHTFRIATRVALGVDALPANVQVYWPALAEWMTDLARASVVVIPLRMDVHRSIGLLALFEAMWLGKLVIVSDGIGIREFVTDGESGLVVDGSAESFRRAIAWARDPAHAAAVKQMREQAARTVAEVHTLAAHTRALTRVMEHVCRVRASKP